MRGILLAALLSTASGASEDRTVYLTTGQVSVLDARGVQTASAADGSVVLVTGVDHDQVVLVGAVPGTTTLTVVVGPPQAPRRIDYRVTVIRDQTLQPFAAVLRATVDRRQRFRVPGLTRVAVGDASMCEALVTGPDELELVPRRAGLASMLVWTAGHDAAHRRQLVVSVESGGFARNADEADAVRTEPLDGRLVLIAGERAVIDGRGALQFGVVDEAVAHVREARRGELVVEARAMGATRLRLWTGGPRPQSILVVVHAHTPPEADDDAGPDVPAPLPAPGVSRL